MHLRRLLSVLVILVLLPLAGCVVSDRELFADQPGATPLPDAFILFSQNPKKPEGGRVYRDGDYYVALEDDDAAVYRLLALDGTDGTYFVGIDRDDNGVGANYALVRIKSGELIMVAVDADWLKVDQDVTGNDLLPVFAFDDREKLLAMFRRAASQAETQEGWMSAESSFRIYDLSDPAQRAEGENLLADAHRLREEAEQE